MIVRVLVVVVTLVSVVVVEVVVVAVGLNLMTYRVEWLLVVVEADPMR